MTSLVSHVTLAVGHVTSLASHVANGGPTSCTGRVDVAKSVNMNTYTLPLKMEVRSYTITDSVTMDMLLITVM